MKNYFNLLFSTIKLTIQILPKFLRILKNRTYNNLNEGLVSNNRYNRRSKAMQSSCKQTSILQNKV